MSELFPVLCGVFVGLVGGVIPSGRTRVICVTGLAVTFGVLATIVSGEIEIGGEFLLIDIPLALVSALVTMLATKRIRRYRFE